MQTRTDIENLEEQQLSAVAMKSRYSLGRRYKEKEHPYRSIYQRDRDRIIHCSAFRRLEYKTQVYVYHEGDYYRTRLTHTLEVAQIGRTIAKALSLNEDLTEALCLAHDLGHTPFGHAGEDTLNILMENHGGFDHNLQGLRVVDILETRYPTFDGLNLSWEVREGIVKHTTRYNNIGEYLKDFPELKPNENPTLEAQVMDKADEIAYNNHDLDDGIKSNILSLKDLGKLKLWNSVSKKIKEDYAGLKESDHAFKALIIRGIINNQVTDLINTTDTNIKKLKLKDYRSVRTWPHRIIQFSKEMAEQRDELREFLNDNFYWHWRVVKMSYKHTGFLKKLFKAYCDNPKILDPYFQKRIKTEKLQRVVCDYIAGMTDRYALEEYKKLFDPYEKI